MNEAEKAREAREKAELAQQKHREELQRQREENRNIRKQKMPKIIAKGINRFGIIHNTTRVVKVSNP